MIFFGQFFFVRNTICGFLGRSLGSSWFFSILFDSFFRLTPRLRNRTNRGFYRLRFGCGTNRSIRMLLNSYSLFVCRLRSAFRFGFAIFWDIFLSLLFVFFLFNFFLFSCFFNFFLFGCFLSFFGSFPSFFGSCFFSFFGGFLSFFGSFLSFFGKLFSSFDCINFFLSYCTR